jgi:hypothetical protein
VQESTDFKDNQNQNENRKRKKRVWVVQHENYQPYLFSNHTSALEHARFIVSTATHDYDGSKWIDPDSYVGIVGYNLNDIQSPAFVLTENLFNKELILQNNDKYEADH